MDQWMSARYCLNADNLVLFVYISYPMKVTAPVLDYANLFLTARHMNLCHVVSLMIVAQMHVYGQADPHESA